MEKKMNWKLGFGLIGIRAPNKVRGTSLGFPNKNYSLIFRKIQILNFYLALDHKPQIPSRLVTTCLGTTLRCSDWRSALLNSLVPWQGSGFRFRL